MRRGWRGAAIRSARGTGALTVLAAAVGAAGEAQAHQAIPGVGGFAGLVLHPLATPDTVLCLLAAGLLVGLASPLRLGLGLVATVAGVVVGSASQLVFTGPLPALVFVAILNLPLALAALGGILVALAPRLGPPALAVTVALLAAMTGMLVLAEGPGAMGLVKPVAGTALGAMLTVAVAAAPVHVVSVRFGRVPARVAGSWLAAIAILMLALSLRDAGQWQLGVPTAG